MSTISTLSHPALISPEYTHVTGLHGSLVRHGRPVEAGRGWRGEKGQDGEREDGAAKHLFESWMFEKKLKPFSFFLGRRESFGEILVRGEAMKRAPGSARRGRRSEKGREGAPRHVGVDRPKRVKKRRQTKETRQTAFDRCTQRSRPHFAGAV